MTPLRATVGGGRKTKQVPTFTLGKMVLEEGPENVEADARGTCVAFLALERDKWRCKVDLYGGTSEEVRDILVAEGDIAPIRGGARCEVTCLEEIISRLS